MAQTRNPSSTSNNPDIELDEWGEPLETKQCFLCGSPYIVSNSTAEVAYQGTYCSVECHQKDEARMKAATIPPPGSGGHII